MTREEAIADIRDNIKPVVGGISLDMAIEALERQPYDDCIRKQVVLDMLQDINAETEGVGFYYEHYVKYIKDLPSVTPKEKTGRWIFDEILDRHYYCSECKSMGVDYWDYCPNCGCHMIEPQESENKEGK